MGIYDSGDNSSHTCAIRTESESENEKGVSCDNTLAIINPMNHLHFLLFLQLKFRIPDLEILALKVTYNVIKVINESNHTQ